MNANPFLRMNPLLRLNQVPQEQVPQEQVSQDEVKRHEEIGFLVRKKPDGTRKVEFIGEMKRHFLNQLGIATGEHWRDELHAQKLAKALMFACIHAIISRKDGGPDQPDSADLEELGRLFYQLCGWIRDVRFCGDPATVKEPMERLKACLNMFADDLQAGGFKLVRKKSFKTSARVFAVKHTWDSGMRKMLHLHAVKHAPLGLLLILAVHEWFENNEDESPPSPDELSGHLYKLFRISVKEGKGANIVSPATVRRVRESVGLKKLPRN